MPQKVVHGADSGSRFPGYQSGILQAFQMLEDLTVANVYFFTESGGARVRLSSFSLVPDEPAVDQLGYRGKAAIMEDRIGDEDPVEHAMRIEYVADFGHLPPLRLGFRARRGALGGTRFRATVPVAYRD